MQFLIRNEKVVIAITTSLLFLFSSLGAEIEDSPSLSLVKKLIGDIKNDKANGSFHDMLHDKVMKEHTASNHQPNQPFFYSDDVYVIQDIIDLVLEDPEGIIDEITSTGFLKIYRESDYPHEIEELFDRETRPPRKFQDAYLGQTATGPTNKVVVVLKIKGDEQTENTLEKRLAYFQNNIRYVDAYPLKGSVDPLDPSKDQGVSEPKGSSQEGSLKEE